MQQRADRLPPLPLPEPPRSRTPSVRNTLLVILVLGVTSGLVGGTAAAFNATTTNPGFIATPSLPGPTGPFTATISNANISLTWTNGGLGSGNEYEVYRSNGGNVLATAPANCPVNTGGTGDTAYTAGTAIGNAAGTPLTDATTATMTSTANGFLCYMLFGAFTSGSVPSAPTWLSHPVASPFNPIANAHLPLIVKSVIFTCNAGTCGTATSTLDTNDTIQLTFNQPTTAPAISGSTNVCITRANGDIWLGASFGANTCGGTGQFGVIAPPAACGCFTTVSATKDPNYTATYTWNPAAGSGCPTTGTANGTVLCIKVTAGANTPLTFTNNTSVWTLTPSTTANVQSNDATVANRVGVCTSTAACTPGTTTRP
jgi:hypothetical protein